MCLTWFEFIPFSAPITNSSFVSATSGAAGDLHQTRWVSLWHLTLDARGSVYCPKLWSLNVTICPHDVILVRQGENIPVGLLMRAWASSRLTTQIAQLLIQEALGLHASIHPIEGQFGASPFYALAGCDDFDDPFKRKCGDKETLARLHKRGKIWLVGGVTVALSVLLGVVILKNICMFTYFLGVENTTNQMID